MQNELDDEMSGTAGATALRTGDDRHAAGRRLEKERARTSEDVVAEIRRG